MKAQLELDEGDVSHLNKLQRKAFSAVIRSGRSLLLTGAGGCGKSFCLGAIRKALRAEGRHVAVTAMTGAAAVLVNGQTLHRWAGIGLGAGSAENLAKALLTDRKKYQALERWRTTQVLIIDEISMLDKTLFEKLDIIGREVRNRKQLPWGGLQVVLCGDFAQLPPVRGNGFCFESERWRELIRAEDEVELLQIIRQSDTEFCKALGEIRMGQVSDETAALFRKCVGAQVGDEFVRPTIMLSLRSAVQKINDEELEKIDQPVHTFRAYDTFRGVYPSSRDMRERMEKFADESLQAQAELKLKLGAQVMLLFNASDLLVNGSRGAVIGFRQDGVPLVHFLNGAEVYVERHKWIVKVGDKTHLVRDQIPLILAYAATIHKSQGATVECAEVDISRCFEYGQAYTALSRAKSLEGLSLKSGDLSRVTVHPKVRNFYRALRERQQKQQTPPPPKTIFDKAKAGSEEDCSSPPRRSQPSQPKMRQLALPDIVERRKSSGFPQKRTAPQAEQGTLPKIVPMVGGSSSPSPPPQKRTKTPGASAPQPRHRTKQRRRLSSEGSKKK
jgi:ATP-dependent DNA helicase PIF1